MAESVRFGVVRLSQAFAELWDLLASDVGAAWTALGDEPVPRGPETAAVVVAAGGDEHALLRWLESHEPPPGVPLFAVGADLGRRIAARSVAGGASDYFALPDDLELLRNSLARAVAQRLGAQHPAGSAGNGPVAPAFSGIVGESEALKAVLARAERVLPHTTTVLIIGETGTGKELLAKAMHDGGPRSGAPFVPVNCSALPANLIESELFGHEAGAFTDARAPKPGLFEVADGGTLFLDEIGALPLELQAKLLRAIQERQVRRVGGTRVRDVDLRLIAATNDDLERSVRQRSFREDLYYRLSVVTLSLPPLRERGEDVLIIAQTLIERQARHHGLPTPTMGPAFRRALLAHDWPGNVRELRNAIERSLVLSRPGEIDTRELVAQTESEVRRTGVLPFPAELDQITSAAARATLALCGGNRSDAARRLRVSRQRLRRMLAVAG